MLLELFWQNAMLIDEELHITQMELLGSSDALSLLSVFTHSKQEVKSNEHQFTNCFQLLVICCSCGPVDVIWNVHWDSHLFLCNWVGMSVCLGLHGNEGMINVGASLV